MGFGFTESAPVCPTDQRAVLAAIVAKLREDLSDIITETTCFISDTPWPSVEVNDHLFITVAPRDGQFDGDAPIGAASRGIIEHATIQVTAWSRAMLDRIEQAESAFSDDDQGLLVLKKRILRSLAGQQIYSDAPTNEVPLLVEWLRPTRSIHPPLRQHEDSFSSFSLAFEAPFYWDLS